MKNNSNDTKGTEIKTIILDNDKDKLEIFLKENINEINFYELYQIALTNGSVECLKILTKYDKNYKKNNKVHYNFKNYDYLLQDENINPEILKFLIENGLEVPRDRIEYYIKQKKFDLLIPIFDYFYFLDNNIILKLIFYYKNKISLSDRKLIDLISYTKNTKLQFDINDRIDYGLTLLSIACELENEQFVKYLIKLGAETNNTKDKYETPLMIACFKENEKLVKYLVEYGGADINDNNKSDNNSLYIACRSGNENIVKYLVEHGANVNNQVYYTNNNYEDEYYWPIIEACKNEFIAKYLIEHGAKINQNDSRANTPLIVSCEIENESLVKYLVEHGADINKKNPNEYI